MQLLGLIKLHAAFLLLCLFFLTTDAADATRSERKRPQRRRTQSRQGESTLTADNKMLLKTDESHVIRQMKAHNALEQREYEISSTVICNQQTGVVSTGLCQCDGGVFDLLSDWLHCGSCTKQCSLGEACIKGRCSCNEGLKRCDGQCVDLESDSSHCGKCGHCCPFAAHCVNGHCHCHGDSHLCGDECVDLDHENEHCGKCWHKCHFPEYCCNGRCRDLAFDPNHCGCCSTRCNRGREACLHGACIDILADELNCGKVGAICAVGEKCCKGKCTAVDNELNCGGCGRRCIGENEACVFSNCVNLLSDFYNCGTPGFICGSFETCSGGKCRSTLPCKGQQTDGFEGLFSCLAESRNADFVDKIYEYPNQP